MKLIDLYIENFGKLRAYRYSFSDALNVIYEENGYGKSTLAAFIKSMLYGMEDTRRTKLDENDRKKYLPWGGGTCGGTLTIAVGDKRYRIERTFAAKASDDTFALYDCDSGRKSSDYTENLGEELFGINADGFERTVFLSERRLSVKNDNKTVSAKLSDLVGYDCDLGELDRADEALDERRKYYQKRGGAGKISEVASSVSSTEAEINELLRLREDLPEKESRLTEVESEITALEQELAQFESRRQTRSYEKQYLERRAAREEAEARLRRAREFFAKGFPTQAELRMAERADEDYRAMRDKAAISRDTPNNTEQLTHDIDEIAHLTEAMRTEEVKVKKSSPAATITIILIMSVLLCAIGGAVAAALSLYAGIAAIAAGVILLCVGVAVAFSSKKTPAEPQYLFAIRALLSREGIRLDGEEYLTSLLELKVKKENELRQYNERLNNIKKYERAMAECKARCDEFLAKFPTVSDDPYAEIRSMLSEHEYAEENVRRLTAELAAIVRDYGVNVEKLNSGSVIISDGADATREDREQKLRDAQGRRALLSNECNRIREELSQLDELYARRDELHKKLSEYKERLNVINLTREHLGRAKDLLTAKYLGKTRAAFAEYLRIIDNDDPSLFTMDTSFGIVRADGGVSRPHEAYSLGTREAYSLISRLALIDSLYDAEQPFVLLDDPFVHFDDRRTQAAVRALKKIADKKQIIYFTCSKSRSI